MRQNWQMWSGAIPDEVIHRIIECAGDTERATTFNNNDETVRSSKVSWLSDQKWIMDLLFDYVDAANKAAFQVNIHKKAEIQFTEYHGTEGGHYAWHHDIFWNRSDGLDRKLSVTVQLSDPSDYEGGEFSFSETETPDVISSKIKGTVLVFPSYLVHAVSPVSSGLRRSLVAWFEGPKWT